MPFNGSGVFSIVNTFVPGTTIFSAAVNANYSDIATGLSTAVLKDGTQTITANIGMAGFKFTSLGAGTNPADSVRVDQLPGLVPLNLARRNGGFEIWQRGAGGAATFTVAASTTAYTADGWYLKTGANQQTVVSQETGLTNVSQWCGRVRRSGGQTGTGVMTFGFPFDTDEIYPLLGQYVCVSFTLIAGADWSPASGNITIALNVGTGTPVKFTVGYTGATVAGTLTQAITTSATRYQFTTAAIIPTTTRQMEITATWTPVGTAGSNDYFAIDDVQIQTVSSATQAASAFQTPLFQEQMALCLRHFYKTFLYGTAPVQNATINSGEISSSQVVGATTAQQIGFRFSTVMRIAPSMTGYNPGAANAAVRNETGGTDCSAVSILNVTANGAVVALTTPGGSAAGNLLGYHMIADAGI